MDYQTITSFVIALCAHAGLPMTIAVAIGVRSMLGFAQLSMATYQSHVRTAAESTVIDEILKILPGLFERYGLTIPEPTVNIASVVSGVAANAANGQDTLSVLSQMLMTLSEQGLNSPYFTLIRQAVIAAIVGG